MGNLLTQPDKGLDVLSRQPFFRQEVDSIEWARAEESPGFHLRRADAVRR